MLFLQPGPHILSQTGHLTASDVQWVSECSCQISDKSFTTTLSHRIGWLLMWLHVLGCDVNHLYLLRSAHAANSEEVSGAKSTLPAAFVSRGHHCSDAAIPRCFASARQDGAWATLQFPVHWPASDVLCAECQLVEIWCECCAQYFVLKPLTI